MSEHRGPGSLNADMGFLCVLFPPPGIYSIFNHFKWTQYPVGRISHFPCVLCQGMDTLCQRNYLCVTSLGVVFRSQGSSMIKYK